MELWHVPFCKHWAVLNKNARHHCFPRSARNRTLHVLHIFLVFRLHTLQRPCGPVPNIWFTPSKQFVLTAASSRLLVDRALSGCVIFLLRSSESVKHPLSQRSPH
ncbi:conserved hypothetical protein [Trichinella spiralis]|uniref:hypothetical protein n=1 Tax=Trichinella spiralis TaxID=6334 RepID=UPI0001EFCF6B|nr:conserved hypothetical protein [Trichinella spiralis]